MKVNLLLRMGGDWDYHDILNIKKVRVTGGPFYKIIKII